MSEEPIRSDCLENKAIHRYFDCESIYCTECTTERHRICDCATRTIQEM